MILHDAERSHDDATGFFRDDAIAAGLLAGEGCEEFRVGGASVRCRDGCWAVGVRRRIGGAVAGEVSRFQTAS